MRLPARFPHRRHLVVERRPVAREHMRAGDDDVDLARALANRIADLLEPLLQGREPGRKAGRDGCDRNPRALERLNRGRHHRRIDADRAHSRRRLVKAERLEEVVGQRLPRLGAETAHALRRVVSRERCEVDAGHRLHKPRRLPFLLDRAARRQRRGAPLDRARIDPDTLEGAWIQRNAGIARSVVAFGGKSRFSDVHRRPRFRRTPDDPSLQEGTGPWARR